MDKTKAVFVEFCKYVEQYKINSFSPSVGVSEESKDMTISAKKMIEAKI